MLGVDPESSIPLETMIKIGMAILGVEVKTSIYVDPVETF